MTELTFLGTGTSQGVPVIACACEVCCSLDFRDKRLRTSVHVKFNGYSLVIDTGPDFRQQMLRENITHVDAILFTHAHKDHTAGMDDIRSFNFKDNRDMPVYATDRVIQQLKQEFAYVFSPIKYPGTPNVALREITKNPFVMDDGQTTIVPVEVMHYKLPVLGFRFGNLTYITDANYIAPEEMAKIEGSEILIINALRKETHISHFNLEEALAVVERIQPRMAYLTHISHHLGLHAEVSKELPPNVRLAYDGLKVRT
ncbi:MBL fold metallo-hydrolase [Rhodoflexus caldus]|uniref:MBL fold metallo-hydrolase n=1 Tax=Rhodoflexus caldus TaxID=2891236 RepID=UPI002029F498|nr:MBL fold metallo-hydrolase [Rhodoflexus caldus]